MPAAAEIHVRDVGLELEGSVYPRRKRWVEGEGHDLLEFVEQAPQLAPPAHHLAAPRPGPRRPRRGTAVPSLAAPEQSYDAAPAGPRCRRIRAEFAATRHPSLQVTPCFVLATAKGLRGTSRPHTTQGTLTAVLRAISAARRHSGCCQALYWTRVSSGPSGSPQPRQTARLARTLFAGGRTRGTIFPVSSISAQVRRFCTSEIALGRRRTASPALRPA
jgi:hypothetical protein